MLRRTFLAGTMNDLFDFWQDVDKPKWLNDSNYITVMGSRAYGNATEDSDWDFYGFCTPPSELLFPHLSGDIPDFGNQKKRFNQLQLQHIPSKKYGDTDLTIYNIVRYFHLVMGGNPNMLDSLFVPEESILHIDYVGEIVRENRYMFLSQKIYHTFRGMAYSHMKRITSRTRKGKRKEHVERYGYDVKDASNVVRLLFEVNDFLFSGDADISNNSEYISDVRSGNWTLEELELFFEREMAELKIRVHNGESVIPKYPNQDKIKNLLVNCLEERYGSLEKFGYNILG